MRDALGAVQSVLVLGGSSDIGVAIAQKLARPRGASVVLAGRDAAALQAAAARVRGAGAGIVDTTAFDADDVDSHGELAQKLFAQRDYDVVVLAAGVLGDQAAAEADYREAVAVWRTNFLGCASIAMCVAQHLRRQGHGTLVVLSSVAAERVRRSNFVYGAAKAGLDGLAQGLGDSLVATGARVIVVRPGFVTTKMTQGRESVPFSSTPQAVADAVDNAIRRGSEIVWVPASLRLVMAVLRHVPRVVFRRLPL
ncbi:MAG: decaprenylphospho-beta-D-erythro-pentofuranosid-2-ulose 2-reductase [Nitriliruptorales bacterium]|nr:decaprenylphospho-beta-D-erythro-pentofuranosid-2-ulose 2-reductase [Nitriliruptorales bacterium]